MRTQRSNYEKNKKTQRIKNQHNSRYFFTIHAMNYLSFFRKIFYALLYINVYLQRHTDFVQMFGVFYWVVYFFSNVDR